MVAKSPNKISVESTPSAIGNNLSSVSVIDEERKTGSRFLAYASGTDPVILVKQWQKNQESKAPWKKVQISTPTPPKEANATTIKNTIQGLQLFSIGQSIYLLCGLQISFEIQIYRLTRTSLDAKWHAVVCFTFTPGSDDPSQRWWRTQNSGRIEAFSKTSTVVRRAVGGYNLCVGTASGHVFVFSFDETSHFKFRHTMQIGPDNTPISDLASHVELIDKDDTTWDSILVVGQEDGNITFWNIDEDNKGNRIMGIDVGEDSETEGQIVKLELYKNYVIVGILDGQVKIYQLDLEQNFMLMKVLEVKAHCSWLSSLHVERDKGLIVTCAEDGTLHLFNFVENGDIIEGNTGKALSPVLSVNYARIIFCGVHVYVNVTGNRMVTASAYDHKSIYELCA